MSASRGGEKVDCLSGSLGLASAGFTRFPDSLLEALAASPLSGRQMSVVLAIVRLTHGWQKSEDRIGSTQLSSMTGIDRRNLRRVVQELVDMKIIHRRSNGPGKTPTLGIANDLDAWTVGCTPGRRKPGSPTARVQAPPGSREPVGRVASDPTSRVAQDPTPQTEETLSTDSTGSSLKVAWDHLRGAYAAYGCELHAQLTPFRDQVRKLIREHPERGLSVLAQVAHGYRARHLKGGSGDFDPEDHFVPQTLFRYAATYLEHYDRMLGRGKTPPFLRRHGQGSQTGPGQDGGEAVRVAFETRARAEAALADMTEDQLAALIAEGRKTVEDALRERSRSGGRE